MTGHERFSRRRLLGGIVGLSIWMLLKPLWALRPAAPDVADGLAAKLASVFSDKESASFVGRACLPHLSAPGDCRQLAERIGMSQSSSRAALAQADGPALRQLLAEQQRHDFAAGRVINVQGWILSETEAQLYAFAAQHASSR
jgi:hypothetical protein